MFSWKKQPFSPTGQTPTMLKEHLIDENDVELAPKATPADDIGAELDAKLQECNIELLNETEEEKKERLTLQEKWDNKVMLAYTCTVAVAIVCNVFAMIAYQMGIIEIAFIIPLVTGPVVIHQREGLIKCRKKREWIAELRNDSKEIKKLNDKLEANINVLQQEVDRLKGFESKLTSIAEKQGQDVNVFRALVKENGRINDVKKQMVEAIALQDLLSSVIQTDMNGDHFIGDSELNMLAFRLQQIEGVPFSGEELCTRFARWPGTKNLRSLVDCVRTLYIEKRREQVAAKEAHQTERLPRQLGTHLLWNDKMSYGVKIAHGVKA